MKLYKVIENLGYINSEFIDYCRNKTSINQILDNCNQGAWLMQLAIRLDVDKKNLAKAKYEILLSISSHLNSEVHTKLLEALKAFSLGEIGEYKLPYLYREIIMTPCMSLACRDGFPVCAGARDAVLATKEDNAMFVWTVANTKREINDSYTESLQRSANAVKKHLYNDIVNKIDDIINPKITEPIKEEPKRIHENPLCVNTTGSNRQGLWVSRANAIMCK